MVSFENFVKSMPSSLSELKVIPSFCFTFKIPDDVTATIIYSYADNFQDLNFRFQSVRLSENETNWHHQFLTYIMYLSDVTLLIDI